MRAITPPAWGSDRCSRSQNRVASQSISIASAVEAIYGYATEGAWAAGTKDDFRYRRTDGLVREAVLAEVEAKLTPLSVSSDRITHRLAAGTAAREGFERSGIRFDAPAPTASSRSIRSPPCCSGAPIASATRRKADSHAPLGGHPRPLLEIASLKK